MGKIRLNIDADPSLHSERPVLVLLHGFTQDLAAWDGVRDGLRRIGPTVALDLIGHGASPKPETLASYRMEGCLEQVADMLARLRVPRAWWVGYSMGGRVALQLAVNRPELVQGLVLISTMAGFHEIKARAARISADDALAARIPAWGVEAFVDYWLSLPLFEGVKRLPEAQQQAMRRQRLQNSTTALANSLRGMGAGAMMPLWANLRDIAVPALILAGELDERFVALARSLAAAMPQGHLSIIPDVGHAAHLEAPGRFLNAVIGFFDRMQAA